MKLSSSKKKISEIIIERNKSKIKVKEAKFEGKYPFYTSGIKIKAYDEHLCDGNNIFIATGGKSIIQYYEGKASYSTDCYTITTKQNVITKYLFYFLKTKLKEIDTKMFEGAAIRHLQKKKFKDIEINIPTLNVQQYIVSKLDVMFAEINKSYATAKLNKNNIHNLFEIILNNTFSEKKNKDWVSNKLKNITSKIGSGATPRGGKNAYKKQGLSLIRSMNIHDLRFVHKGLVKIDKKQAQALDNVEVHKNDILLNITGASVARCAMVDNDVLPARVNQHVSIIRVNSNVINPKLLVFMLASRYFKNRLLKISNAGGATREALTKEQIKNFEILFPRSIKKQDEIIKQLSKTKKILVELIGLYENKIEKLEILKQSFLQEYLDYKQTV